MSGVDKAAPPAEVVSGFGAAGRNLVPLAGGQGRAWAAGRIVLKPVDDVDVATWSADVLDELEVDGVRVERPVRTAAGEWLVDGWSAWTRLEGSHASSAQVWPQVFEAGRRLHDALRNVPPPPSSARRTDPWALGDRVAWGEVTYDPISRDVDSLLRRAGAELEPVHQQCQAIHGDLAGNVLFAAGLPPAVIDLSPFWRPAGWSLAIAASDAIAWFEAPAEIIGFLADVPDLHQLMLRAVVFRAVTADVFARFGRPVDLQNEVRAYEQVLGVIDSL